MGVVKELTEIVASAAGDPGLAERTWVLIVESPHGGWGIAGHANTNADIANLARRALAGGWPKVGGSATPAVAGRAPSRSAARCPQRRAESSPRSSSAPSSTPPWGFVRAGASAATIETVATIGASAAVVERGQFAVVVNNSADLIRPLVAGGRK